MKKPTQPPRCAFCNGQASPNVRLLPGPHGIFICSECVELLYSIVQDEKKRGRTESFLRGGKLPTPSEIKAQLDQYVIGQERAKKVLSVAVYNHYKRLLSSFDTRDVEIEKTNILIVGPTGCGKTLLARTLASILHVPFAIGDATTLTEAGYVGEDVENLLLRLLQAADFDLPRAQQGIIFLDEVDKIAKAPVNVSITRDVGGEGVQRALLKLLEGTVANVPPQGGRKHPEQQYIPFDTTHVLFICGGAFVGLEQIVSQRIGKSGVGFKRDFAAKDEKKRYGEIMQNVIEDDLIQYGMIPEFVGRVPVIVALDDLDENDLVRILTEPRNAIIKQYKKMFEMEGKTLEVEDEALHEIAKKALKKGTGARGLRAIVEELLLDVVYEMPSRKDVVKYVVTKEFVLGEAPAPIMLTKDMVKTKPRRKKRRASSA